MTPELQDLYEKEARETLAGGLLPYVLRSFRENADRFVEVMKVVRDLDPKSILDLGCSFGLVGGLVGVGRRVVGVDQATSVGESAMDTFDYAQIYELGVDDPFNLAEKFDLVLCLEVLEHQETDNDMAWVVLNAARHTRPDGRILFSTPLEGGTPDGIFHRRVLSSAGVMSFLEDRVDVVRSWVVPSLFGEKPRWQGWTFCLAKPRVVE